MQEIVKQFWMAGKQSFSLPKLSITVVQLTCMQRTSRSDVILAVRGKACGKNDLILTH